MTQYFPHAGMKHTFSAEETFRIKICQSGHSSIFPVSLTKYSRPQWPRDELQLS